MRVVFGRNSLRKMKIDFIQFQLARGQMPLFCFQFVLIFHCFEFFVCLYFFLFCFDAITILVNWFLQSTYAALSRFFKSYLFMITKKLNNFIVCLEELFNEAILYNSCTVVHYFTSLLCTADLVQCVFTYYFSVVLEISFIYLTIPKNA